MRRIFIFCVALFCMSSSLAQVSYTHQPKNNQLYPRNASDSADVTLSGVIQQQGVLSAIYKLYRNGVLVDSTDEVLSYQNSVAPFSKVFKIKAEKAEYKVHFSLYDGQLYDCVLTADSIVAGDVFVVNGQSNGSAPSQGPGAIVSDEWVRSFGTASFSDVDCTSDTLWGLGIGNTTQADLAIGVWSMKLAKLLSDSLQIPICIINGSRYGSRIVTHLPNVNNHADLKTNYGRLLFRVNKAGVANAVKGLFWYQGESDGDTAHAFYSGRFNQLYNSWKTDFPGLNRIFVLQTRPGCVVGTNFLYHQKIREAQRNFGIQYSDITLMSTAALPNFDGCHYLSTGYNILATHLYFQVMKAVYGQNAITNVDPPNILNATFIDSSNTLLAIKMSQAVLWPAVLNGNNLKDYFYFSNSGISVLNGWASQDTVYLQLSSSSLVEEMSYLPNIYYNGSTTQIFQGPWLMNSRNIGALAFYQMDLAHQLNIQAQGATILCNGDSVLLTSNKNALNFQWYKNGIALANENSNAIWVNAPGNYVLRMTDSFGNDIESNGVEVLKGDTPVSITASGNSICDGDAALLSVNVNANSAILWSTGSNFSSISVTTAGWHYVSVIDSLGCVSEDSLELTVHANPTANLLYTSLTICEGDSARLYLENSETGVWSNGVVDSAIYVNISGFYAAVVTNNYGCSTSSDTVEVIVHALPTANLLHQSLTLCDGDSTQLYLENSESGVWSTGSVDTAIYVNSSGFYSAVVTNSFGCSAASDTVQVVVHSRPTADLMHQSLTICNGDSTRLYLGNNETGVWSNGSVDSVIYAKTTGYYSAVVTNSFGCSTTSDTVYVNVINTLISVIPSGPLSTCSNQKITLSINNYTGTNYQWRDNGVAIQGATAATYKPSESGNYAVSLIDSFGCFAQSQTVMLTVNKAPASKYTITNQFNTCIDSLVTLTANSGTGLSYQWYRNGIVLPGMTNKVLNTQMSGNYSVLVTNPWGCTKLSAVTAIPILNPTASIQVMGSANICTGDSVKLSANTGIGYSYQWTRNNIPISGATSSFYYVKQKGFYKVVITNSSGCSATSNGKSITVVACNVASRFSPEPDFDLDLVTVYPNPFSHSFKIEFENSYEQMRWSLIDVTGRKCLSGEMEPNQQFMELNGMSLHQGMYFLVLESPSAKRIIKIQKAD